MLIKNYCGHCGIKLQYQEAEICPNCRKELIDRYRNYYHYCPNCGVEFDLETEYNISICPHCGVRINKKYDFHLTTFVSENSSIFITSSIFIALAVYLSQFASTIDKTKFDFPFGNSSLNILDIAIGASLFISILISSLIIKKLIAKIFEFKFSSKETELSRFAAIKNIIFLSIFCILILCIFMYFYITYKIVFIIIMAIIAYAFSLYIVYLIEEILKRLSINKTGSEEYGYVKYQLFLGLSCILALIISAYSLTLKSENEFYKILFGFSAMLSFFTFIILAADFLFDLIPLSYELLKKLYCYIRGKIIKK